MISVEFHGAAETVTGSNYLVKTQHGAFIVDCGMFQGPDVEGRNLIPYDYDPKEVSFVLLTHAHIDHSGMLPKLVKHGFNGAIYATNHTIQISTLLLLDSAKIQEGNFEKGMGYGKYTETVALAYNSKDAEDTIGMFNAVDFNETFEPVPGIKVRLIRAGHILGAASMEVTIKDGETEKVLLFSGDIGRKYQPLIESYDMTYHANPDYVFIESLYGGQQHPKREDSLKELMSIVKETNDRNGTVFIPSFAVQRTQEILHDLRVEREDGHLDTSIPVWLDSPLAQRVSQVYTQAVEGVPENRFSFEGLHYVQKYRQSQKLALKNRLIIIAGSGMADGGRIVDHLIYGLPRKKNSIVFVGYQAEGTLGRELVEGAKVVQIGKTQIKVEAKIHHLHGFSAHGDNDDYVNWIRRFNSEKLKNVFLIHAEIDRAEALKKNLETEGFKNLTIPHWKEKIELP